MDPAGFRRRSSHPTPTSSQIQVAHAHDVAMIPNDDSQPVARTQYGVQLDRPLIFRTLQGRPLRLATAFQYTNLEGYLRDFDSPVLTGCGMKYCIIIHLKDQAKFHKQKYAHGRHGPHTLGKVARQIAEVVEAYIQEVENDMPTDRDDWRLGTGYIEFDDLYLYELRQVARASFQVTLGYRRP